MSTTEIGGGVSSWAAELTAVHHALLVRRLERVGNLPGDRQRLVERDGSLRDAVGKRRPVDEFEDERGRVAAVFETVNLRDVRVVQRREELRFAAYPTSFPSASWQSPDRDAPAFVRRSSPRRRR